MRAAMIGCGKLGAPVGLAWATVHDMVGYDISPTAKEIFASRKYPHREAGAQALLETTKMRIVDTVGEAVEHADIAFIAVETPHGPQYEGITRMPETRADFDYTALRSAVASVAHAALVQQKAITIVVISTALPGTCKREIYPLLNEYTGFVYAPMFIAQSTVVEDTAHPEFVLIGFDHDRDRVASLERVQNFFREFHARVRLESLPRNVAQHAVMSATSAELTKVAYNVFLGLKIVAANSIMEIAHKTGANCDDVTDALALATDRVVSAKYMRGGMGDGGGCHPRDQIALSWLAQELELSYDLFGSMVKAREEQTKWLADIAYLKGLDEELPIVILGKAYKKGTNLTVGSPALLLRRIFGEDFNRDALLQWDPHVDAAVPDFDPSVFIIATDHDEFYSMAFPPGSVVIDPWGKMRDMIGVKVVRVGRDS